MAMIALTPSSNSQHKLDRCGGERIRRQPSVKTNNRLQNNERNKDNHCVRRHWDVFSFSAYTFKIELQFGLVQMF